MKKSTVALFWLLLLVVTASSAVSLGRHRGPALIGSALDISVLAVLDGQEDPASLCLDADVFYGDNKLGKSRVRVSAEKISSSGPDAVIHIRSSAFVDEPVVTLYLRVGCQQKTERRYVILADMASEVASSPLPNNAPQAARAAPDIIRGDVATQVGNTQFASDSLASASADRAASRAARRQRSSASSSVPTATSSVLANLPAKTPPTTALQRSKKSDKDSRASAKGGARLKLELRDVTMERDPKLKSSGELLSAPLSTQERSAAAALWRAITAQPQDILRDSEKLQSLGESVRNLQVQAQKNQLAIDNLNIEVKQAQTERYANTLVYLLGVLLLIAVAALAYLLRRSSGSRTKQVDEIPWWRKSAAGGTGWFDKKGQTEPSLFSAGDGTQKVSQKKSVISDGNPELATRIKDSKIKEAKPTFSPSGIDSLPPLSRGYGADYSMSMSHASRAVKAEELFDVQQQADFFVSLEQYEQAIEVLRSHLDDSRETSVLVYLDLFNLYHQLNRQADYEALRDTFNQRFNSKIPAFEFYSDSSPGLEAYQVALSRIEALWPSPKVLEVIEESIFRRPDAAGESFDLEAYRELLMLYSVAREIVGSDTAAPTKKPKSDFLDIPDDDEFTATRIHPLSASLAEGKPEQEYEPSHASVIPPTALNLGLDLDLSELNPDDTKQVPASAYAPAPEAQSDVDSFDQLSAQIAGMERSTAPKPEAPPSAVGKSGNLIDFEFLDSSPIDQGKTDLFKPPKS